ncbi:leucine--tRNA ligase [Tenacibaculum finnmarkense genomovar finnmarkense]|uniref:leucine--tRNA ligase n=1 Tax=Tenacibaculum finnmarkense TaxID=2781243 RepID=UPI001E5AC7D0|nr:class I tRNA ligase family protein [Tenacibaculum finnmarkense]MCD8416806.1 class I tRNA ligase family protein [Tenacibaculum finnmarkense genomovar finnmarkense]MCG8184789.1 leucine--tRNA ligase [Tenacibaculum finnmarkense genomovar finnmarkense]MCG8201595.1 leucine--tRNA ligase [Tenacibaculum finnmarkense genomovar finnmarkense]MCG8208505.1 leucine--tRNA ligase [Tenacibaculum finnmarkense genomovar finnmarkense]MCG8211237.1 leucine--tRNA ligase [Tenacibaculum finnmarkense genomovar finnma
MQYNHQEIEKKWQQFWADNQTFKASNESEKPKYYVLDMFPYPSGAGLHVGHPLGYIASDIYARYKRHKGFNVLHPQGYDSFGLPAEQYAIQTGQHPAITTQTNIETYRSQLDAIGFSFDWSREVQTSSPEYYKWTQWIFIQLFNSWYNKDSDKAEDVSTLISVFEAEGNTSVNAVSEEDIAVFSADDWNGFSDKEKEAILLQYRLTYLSDTEVNWCPGLGTVLANDEIINGVSERGAHPVIRKKMTQWSMRISAYSQRLLDGLENIDWPQPLKDSQTNWIGRSQGAMVTFKVDALEVEAGVKLSFKELEALKEMRLNLSKAEEVLWNELKNKKGASKFRKKYTIGTFLVDYVCLAKNIVVEFSGKEDEAARTTYFANEGLHIVRFTNEEVLENVLGVVSKINNTIQFAKPLEKSTVEVAETVVQNDYVIDVFTTRPDTIYGVSFMTLAPEHELVAKITSESQKKAVYAYIKATAKRSERDRMADVKTISGVFTGAYALHPFTGKQVPIWIGDYVLANYGTGAVMAVPCGDQRDYDFAKNFGLAIPNIFADVDVSETAHADKEGTKIANSDFLNDLSYKKAMKLAVSEMEKQGFGFGKINYRLRDAVFSRQRYWGEPFPVFYKDGMPQMIDAKYLPIVLPEVEKYLPTEDGKPPLGNAEVWAWDTEKNEVVSNDLINNETIFNLELNTMPGWAGSSWYFNRYMDATNDGEFVSKEAADYWKEIDLYIGGSEHATGHLLYARFWQKFLFDKGALPVDEFAKKLINQGMILGTSALVYEALFDGKKHNLYVSADYFQGENQIEDTEADDKLGSRLHKKLVEAGLTEETEESLTYRPIHICVSTLEGDINVNIDKLKAWRSEFETAEFVFGRDNQFVCYREVEKMSKSKYNVVNPDLICEEFGADALRLFEMFLGPLEQTKPWKTSGISGVYSFLKKLWKLYVGEQGVIITEEEPTKEEFKILHKTIKKVAEDIENFSFNTSVSTFMIAVNELTALKCNKRAILEPILALISPYAPHIAEELWNQLGHEGSISTVDFPEFDASYLVESSKNYPVSFNGKMRFTLELALDLSKEEIEKIVLADERTIAQLKGEAPKKIIIVPGKIINLVG